MTPAELRTLREACGLSLPQLATLAGVQERTARYWESGQSNVPADVADVVLRLDGHLSLAAQQAVDAVADFARARPEGDLADIVFLRYRSDADLHRYRPEMVGLPATAHAAIVYRTRAVLAGSGIPCRIVYMVPDAYTDWRGARVDSETLRAEWAGLQVPEGDRL